jgi:acyl-CoA oxidase
LLDAYEWLVCHLLVSTSAKLEHLQSSGQDPFTAKNNSQAFHYRPLSIAYIEATVLRRFITLCSDPQLAPPIAGVLKQLGALYGAFSLLKHASVLFEGKFWNNFSILVPKSWNNGKLFVPGGYFSSESSISLRKVIEELCVAIKPNAIALVDALAPADFALNSILGNSDGNVYRHIEANFTKESGWNQRPSWWRSIVEKPKSNL